MKYCKVCNRIVRKKYGLMCFSCIKKIQRKKTENRIFSITGDSCWYCGYNKGEKGRHVLDFHHVYPNQKKFQIKASLGQSWKNLFKELKKCTLLCALCHREVELSIIDNKKIINLHKNRWNLINAKMYQNLNLCPSGEIGRRTRFRV